MNVKSSAVSRMLVTVSGLDRPGISAGFTDVLAAASVTLLDIQQVVLQGELILAALVEGDAARLNALRERVGQWSSAQGLSAQVDAADVTDCNSLDPERVDLRYAVTAIADVLDAARLHTLTSTLAARSANIDAIRRLSACYFQAVEIIVTLSPGEDGARPAAAGHGISDIRGWELRRALVAACEPLGMDIAVQRERLVRRAKRLVAMDMDSTLIQVEVIDELARLHGVYDQVSAVTQRAMAGELDFDASLRARVALLKGLKYAKVQELVQRLPVTQGARELLRVLHGLGYKTGVISGGFHFAADVLKAQLGLDFVFANRLDVVDGELTGKVFEPIVNAERKAALLEQVAVQEGIRLEQTIAIGDGANDALMLKAAGLGIAFHAKAKLREAADTTLSAGGLDRILYLLGLHANDVEEFLRDSPA